MKNTLTCLLAILFFTPLCFSQTGKAIQPFGKIDTADLRLTDCDFEKGAGALILFDYANTSAYFDSVVVMRHQRIKIFNNTGASVANVRLPYYTYHNFEQISGIEAHTIMLENNRIVVTPVEPQQIYTETTEKNKKTLVFAFPQVKPGCIIEYRYKWKTIAPTNFPVWLFQTALPVRHSELDANISNDVQYTILRKGYQNYAIDTSVVWNKKKKEIGRTHYWALANVHSFVAEPFVTPGNVNLQCMMFRLRGYTDTYGIFRKVGTDSWMNVVKGMLNDEDFGEQLKAGLSKEDDLLKQAQKLKSEDEIIAYLFREVKTAMKWNEADAWYTDKGIRSAWNKKTGNSTEINLILHHLLQKAGIDARPMAISTPSHGALYPYMAGYGQINKTVVYYKPDSLHTYVLDASGKYNVYNELPAEELNTYGIVINEKRDLFHNAELVFLKNDAPAQQSVLINAEISPDGKLKGTAELSSRSYIKSVYTRLYDKLGEQKYTDFLRSEDNNLKITGLQMENAGVDSLPLNQRLNFNLELTSSGGDYIYFNPNLFTPLKVNPFISEERYSDIDYGNCSTYTINGRYKLPKGFKIDVLPKSIQVNLFDNGILFRRIIAEDNGEVVLRYMISYRRSMFTLDEYKNLRDFYKKMYEFLNEPIVLKKTIITGIIK